MPPKLLLEQFHLDVYVLRGLPAAEAEAMRRILKSASFRSRLRRAVAAVFRRYRSLGPAVLDISR
jgi:hypothetical protein